MKIKSKKIKHIPVAKAIKILDHWFELYIRYRDGWKCIVCGTTLPLDTTNMHAGHLIGRTHKKVRWDEINVNAQCKSCNCAHNWDESSYTAKWLEKYGEEAYIELESRSKGPVKLYSCDLLEKAEYYKKLVEEYQNKSV